LIGNHLSCRNRLEEFNRGERRHSHVWYRWYNEVPVLLLVAIVALAIIKPF
jgi:putative membrane protein